MSNTLLQVHKVAKHFGQLKAVDGLSFAVSEGETLGIAGPNGAGKTTLFDVITGMTRATSGTVTFRGRAIQEAPIQEICHLGIARTFQLPTVFDTQTILANALVGAHFGKPKRLWTGLRRDPAIIHRAIQAVEFVGLGERFGDVAGPLPVFDKKRIMIASALATDPVMLFLDEPFGGLNPDETDRLIALFGEIKRLGVTLVLIEHVMRATRWWRSPTKC